ncbi:MAG TPA: heme peroxidase family protein [Acidimicrobiales bacterium]|nr:heme peroxidase family protein [Acidimicrobiales bacterium]
MSTEATAGAPVPGARRDHHGGNRPRGIDVVPRSSTNTGRFGRMFRTLAPLAPPDAELAALADSMGEAPAGAAGDNPDIPSGYTYLGQFVDHDITFDPVSSHDRIRDPDGLHNARTPRFDLDSLYGAGRVDSPYLYDEEDPAKLLVGRNAAAIHEPVDLPRNHQGRALIGDPRNDVHVIVAQLHLAFIRFHNAVVDHLRMQFVPDEELLPEARRLTCWHYQWVVVDDHLRRLVGSEVLDSVLVRSPSTGKASAALAFFRWRSQPFIPVEFSGAAYRFGHSQVRDVYRINDAIEPLPILTDIRIPNPLQHLGGFRPLPRRWTVEWKHFFALGGPAPQPSRKIDTRLSGPMRKLPQNIDRDRRSLALLNMLRGRSLSLPSGQAVAAAMGTSAPHGDLGLSGPTPLWYYLLREAERLEGGTRLGPTGGRIVAEVLVGLLAGDPTSFLRVSPTWTPELPSAEPGRFTMADLLRFAGAA